MSTPDTLNLNVLKRTDPSIHRIIATSRHAAMYKLDAARKWEKLAVEGSLFVFERTQQPLWGFHILNQQSTENFHQPITMGMKVEHKKPFLIYKAEDGTYYGIWIHSDEERSTIGDLLSGFASQLTTAPKTLSYANMAKPVAAAKEPEKMMSPAALAAASQTVAALSGSNTDDASDEGARLMGLLQSASKPKQPSAATVTQAQNGEGARLMGLLQGASAKAASPAQSQAAAPAATKSDHLADLFSKAISSKAMQSSGATAAAPAQNNEGNRLAGLLANATQKAAGRSPAPANGAGADSTPFAAHERQSPPQFEPVQHVSALPPRGSPLATGGKKIAKSMAHLLQKPGVPKAAAPATATAPNAVQQSAMLGGSAMMAEIPTTLNQILNVQHQRQATPKLLSKAQLGKMLIHMLTNDPNFLGSIHTRYETMFAGHS